MSTLRDAWESAALEWIAWARAPGHDAYWLFHRDQFLELLPPPRGLTLDIGCGEGRLSRDLRARGHHVIGIDGSQTLVEAARREEPAIEVFCADAAALPIESDSVDLAIAFMSPQDVDDLPAMFREARRVLRDDGRFAFAVLHPLCSAGRWASDDADAPFVITGSYLDARRWVDRTERAGLTMTFTSEHRSIDMYSRALEGAGFCIEAIREHKVPSENPRGRWQRVPLFLHVRARPA